MNSETTIITPWLTSPCRVPKMLKGNVIWRVFKWVNERKTSFQLSLRYLDVFPNFWFSMLISFPGEPDNIGLKPNDVMWGDGDLADGKGVDDMNWAVVVNCVHVNEDCAGVDVNCVGVDLDDVCAGADDDCSGVDNVWVGLDEVCAVEDVDCGIGMTGLPASGSLSSSSIVSSWSSWLAASLLFLKNSRIARSCFKLGRDLLLLMSAKAISTGHHQRLLSGLPQLGLLLHVSNSKNKHKTL